MDTFFLLCAVVGGTIMVLQIGMTLLGLGGDSDGSDLGSDVDLGGDIGGDAGGHDFSSDLGDGHVGADHGGVGEPAAHHGTVWIFKVLTFQTLVAAIAFFGLAGHAARQAEMEPVMAVLVAVSGGIAAMYGVYYLMRGMHKFNADGTVQINRAVGLPGTVYVSIPGSNAGAGKIQMNLQNRIVEFQAMTGSDRLPSGAKIRVVGILGPDTVAVEPLIETEKHSHA